ncbi:hypothetical protein RBB50_005106 [Rhinocladiella similis]
MNRETLILDRFDGSEVTDAMLQQASILFNEHYGVWSRDPMNHQTVPKPGSRVKMSPQRLRAQCLPDGVECLYVMATIEGQLAGNAFACPWKVQNKVVSWITQLVVHTKFRRRSLAVSLLNFLRRPDDNIYGIMSSQPVACLAAAKAFRSGINSLSAGFIRENADNVMKLSPVDYVRNAQLRGSLFDAIDSTGAVSSVFTNFFVDHAEPLRALDLVRQGLDWPLGELLEGHEFLLMIEARIR